MVWGLSAVLYLAIFLHSSVGNSPIVKHEEKVKEGEVEEYKEEEEGFTRKQICGMHSTLSTYTCGISSYVSVCGGDQSSKGWVGILRSIHTGSAPMLLIPCT